MRTLPDDITKNRHRGNPQSAAANKTVNKVIDRQEICAILARVGEATLKELCNYMGRLPNQISGRCSELKANGTIEPTGEVRQRCAVYRLKK